MHAHALSLTRVRGMILCMHNSEYLLTVCTLHWMQNISLSLDRQRYSISSRNQLNEQLSRLLCYLLSHTHSSAVRAAVLRQFWTMDDSRYVLNFVFTSSVKKMVLNYHLCVPANYMYVHVYLFNVVKFLFL